MRYGELGRQRRNRHENDKEALKLDATFVIVARHLSVVMAGGRVASQWSRGAMLFDVTLARK